MRVHAILLQHRGVRIFGLDLSMHERHECRRAKLLYIVGWNRGGELSMIIIDRDRDELARISRPCNEGVCFLWFAMPYRSGQLWRAYC